MLPRLGEASDLQLQPSLVQLASMARSEPASLGQVSSLASQAAQAGRYSSAQLLKQAHALMQVCNFAVIRRGVGRVQWEEPVDVRGLDIASVVRLSKGSVEVYLDGAEKPEVGEGLNKPATVCARS